MLRFETKEQVKDNMTKWTAKFGQNIEIYA